MKRQFDIRGLGYFGKQVKSLVFAVAIFQKLIFDNVNVKFIRQKVILQQLYFIINFVM